MTVTVDVTALHTYTKKRGLSFYYALVWLCTQSINHTAESDALIYFSCLPWVSLTALTNERDFDADDAIPRIAWGKYHREGEREVLGLALEVNHRLIDWLHI